jgi:hypothetical protein
MTDRPDLSELARRAGATARQVAGRLQRQQKDLAEKMPAETQGVEVLRRAALAAERVARLIDISTAGVHSPDSDP